MVTPAGKRGLDDARSLIANGCRDGRLLGHADVRLLDRRQRATVADALNSSWRTGNQQATDAGGPHLIRIIR